MIYAKEITGNEEQALNDWVNDINAKRGKGYTTVDKELSKMLDRFLTGLTHRSDRKVVNEITTSIKKMTPQEKIEFMKGVKNGRLS